jgi:hypothetical protein
MTNAKHKSVDLGALQDSLITARRQLNNDARALERAQAAYDKAREDYAIAVVELKDASRLVLHNQGVS